MFKYTEVASLKLGDKVRCLDCCEKITLTPDTFKIDWEAEYIVCPHCGSRRDVMVYLYGQMGGKKDVR